jgi:hypothetical protein
VVGRRGAPVFITEARQVERGQLLITYRAHWEVITAPPGRQVSIGVCWRMAGIAMAVTLVAANVCRCNGTAVARCGTTLGLSPRLVRHDCEKVAAVGPQKRTRDPALTRYERHR